MRKVKLIDFVFINMSGVRTSIFPSIADCKLVVAEMFFKVSEQAFICRTELQYANADWDKFRSEFDEAI